MKKYAIFDLSNMLYRTFFVNAREDVETIGGLATHMALNTLNKYYKKLSPNKVIFACDRSSWRKLYTKSSKCISGKIYKGDRNQNLTSKQQTKLDEFREHIEDFENMIREHTSIVCLAADGCEADDFVAEFVKMYNKNNEITIISRDKDFVQLLGYNNTFLLDPTKDEYRTLNNYDNDVKWHLFEKCMRANEDNIQCAFPRVRKTRLEKAYKDPFEMENLMNETWVHPNGKKFRVGDLYQENKLLMDLTRQPKIIKKILYKEITDCMENPGKYSHFHFIKFCGKHKLVKVGKNADSFAHMLSS